MSGVKPKIFELPPLDHLQSVLRTCVRQGGIDGADLIVTDRKVNRYATTFPSEIVSCRLSNGEQVDFFCKYWAETNNEAFGHRGGKGYEVNVYSRLLKGLSLPLPVLYGIHQSQDGREVWLVTQYLAEGQKVSKVPPSVDPDAMIRAADWLGKFHAQCSHYVFHPALCFLTRYDSDYFDGWAIRTQERIPAAVKEFPWLLQLFKGYSQVIAILTGASQTILHGEYYPHNILHQNHCVYPIDWESAAIGAGEIDLVTLTDAWSEEKTRQLRKCYESARWPGGAPDHIDRVYFAAMIYLQLRWLSEFGDKTHKSNWRWKTLHRASIGLELL